MPEDFFSEEVAYQVDDIQVYATLTRPVGEGPRPAVVFVAGSGPTDRDWCSPLLPGQPLLEDLPPGERTPPLFTPQDSKRRRDPDRDPHLSFYGPLEGWVALLGEIPHRHGDVVGVSGASRSGGVTPGNPRAAQKV
jgi:hypothetical protein